MARLSPPLRRASGFTYLSVIILVAIIGLAAATTVRLGATLQRAAAERELLYIGEQFSDALKSYAAATPQGQPQQPPTLKELLKDPRFPGTRRHLRKIFVDPITGKSEWGIVYMGEKLGVLGIHSLSTAEPIKVSNFPSRFQTFEGKRKISDWVFTFNGQEPPPPGQLPDKPGAGPATPMTGSPLTGKPIGPVTGTGTGGGAATPVVGTQPSSPLTGTQPTPERPPPAQPAEPEPEPEPPAEPAPEEPPEQPAEPAEPANAR